METGKRKTITYETIILLGLVILLVILLCPCLYISRFTFMQADDYCTVDTIWESTHSFAKTFLFEFNKMLTYYRNQEGLFFADFFYYEINGFLTNARYSWTPYIAIFSLIIGDLIAGKIIIKDILKGTLTQSLLVSVPIAILHVMAPYSAAEAFYWQCSAFLYTPMYSISIIVIATLVRNILDDKCSSFKFLLESLPGAIMVAGVNYTISLPYLCILLLLTVFCFVVKRKRTSMIFTLTWFIGWFLANVLSPGAKIRQAAAGDSGVSAAEAIIGSFKESAHFIRLNMVLPLLFMGIAFAPLFYRIVKDSNRSFGMPWLFSILSYCVFASSFTPCLYALGTIGPYRAMNIYRYSLYILLFVNELYWIGFFVKKFHISVSFGKRSPYINIVFSGVIGLITILGFYFLVFGKQITAVSAYLDIRDGYAQAYLEQYEQRLVVLNDPKVSDCIFEPYENAPYVLFFQDIDKDPNDWRSYVYAEYYGKNTVRLSH